MAAKDYAVLHSLAYVRLDCPYVVLDGAKLYKVVARESDAPENTSFGCLMGCAARPRRTEQNALCEVDVALA